jgi:hypothetical protein
MARVKIEEIVDHLSSEMRAALKAAVDELCRGRKCNALELVPDSLCRRGLEQANGHGWRRPVRALEAWPRAADVYVSNC